MHPSDPSNEWAAANAMLADSKAKPPPDLVKVRQRRILLIVVGVLVAAGIGAAFGIMFSEGSSNSTDVPAVQQVVGLVIAAAGIVLQFWGVRRQWKRGLKLNHWRGPLMGLKRAQRKQLTEQVRGRVPVQDGTIELSTLLARVMIQQRLGIVGNAGLAILWLGLFISSPTWWRALLALVFILLILGAIPFVERDARAAERFVARGSDVAMRTDNAL